MMRQKMSREISKPVSKSWKAILKNAEVVVEDEVDLDKINVGCTVKVFDITFDEEMEFNIGRFYRGEQPGRKDFQ